MEHKLKEGLSGGVYQKWNIVPLLKVIPKLDTLLLVEGRADWFGAASFPQASA
jgi:hypothetical protein